MESHFAFIVYLVAEVEDGLPVFASEVFVGPRFHLSHPALTRKYAYSLWPFVLANVSGPRRMTARLEDGALAS